MTPNINDKFTLTEVGTLTAMASPGYEIGGNSMTAVDLSAWADIGEQTAVYFAVDRVDSKGIRVAGTYTEWKGIVSGNTLGSLTLVKGNDQNYPVGATTRIMLLLTSEWANAIVRGILVSHKQDGTLKDSSVPSSALANAAVTRSKLATLTRKAPLSLIGKGTVGTSAPWPNASDSAMQYAFVIPDDYVSGNIKIKTLIHGGTSGIVRLYRRTYRARSGEALHTIEGSPVFTELTANGTVLLWEFDIEESDFAIGDSLRIELNRDGPGVADTCSQDLQTDGTWAEYTGRA